MDAVETLLHVVIRALKANGFQRQYAGANRARKAGASVALRNLAFMRVAARLTRFEGKRCPEKGMHHTRPVLLG